MTFASLVRLDGVPKPLICGREFLYFAKCLPKR